MSSQGDIDHLEAIYGFLLRRWRRVLLATAGSILLLPYGCGLITGVLIGKLT